jgi:hypothetical protein
MRQKGVVYMEIRKLPYRGPADLVHMAALARRYPGEHLRVMDLPYRFSSWALDDPENVALWWDASGELAAWAVLQAPFWTIDTACRPDCEVGVHPELLAWADQRARSVLGSRYARPSWYVNVFDDQQDRIRDLERAGFSCQANVGEDSWTKVLLRLHGIRPVALLSAAGRFRCATAGWGGRGGRIRRPAPIGI